jgi:hypothetical protein
MHPKKKLQMAARDVSTSLDMIEKRTNARPTITTQADSTNSHAAS